MNTKELKKSYLPLKVLLYGDIGVGKTLFASTFPNPHFIDTENGMVTLRGLDCEYETILEINRSKPNGYKDCRALTNKWMEELAEQGADATIVVDSLTIVNAYALTEAMSVLNHPFPQQNTWGQVLQFTVDFVDALVACPNNVVMTCHEKTVYDELAKTLVARPAMVGQSQEAIPYRCDEVYRLYSDNSRKHWIVTHKDVTTSAKSRLNRENILGARVEWVWDESNPKNNPIFEAVKKHDEEASS